VRPMNHYSVDTTTLRVTGVIALLSIGTIHFVQIVDTFRETPLLGVAYVALIAACLALAVRLAFVDDTRAWAGTALVSAAVIVGYAFTRVAGTTFDNVDVGNWACTLGLASLFVEGSLLALSASALAARSTRTRSIVARAYDRF
jgi:hypothetical protein